MVGLSIVLDAQKSGSINKKTPQVITKVTMMMMINNRLTCPLNFSSSRNYSSQFSFPLPSFLDRCFHCDQKLLPGKDIYMYKGDRGFCSVECRCKQIFIDEEETLRRKENRSFAAMKPSSTSANSASSSSSKTTSSTSASRHHKSTRNREGGSV